MLRSLRLFAFASVFAPLASAACGGETSSTSSTPEAAVTTPDAGVTPPEKAAPDAGQATHADGGTTAARWCDGQRDHDFCADFDGASLLEGWTGRAHLAATPSTRSAPNALAIISGLSGTKKEVMTTLTEASASRASVELDVRAAPSTATTATGTGIHLQLTRRTSPTVLEPVAGASLDLLPDSMLLFVAAPSPDGFTLEQRDVPLPRGVWVRIRLDVVTSTTKVKATVTFDGAPVAELEATHASAIDATGAVLRLEAASGPVATDSFVVSVDNVVADVE